MFMLRLGNEGRFPWEEKVGFKNEIPNSTSFSIYLIISLNQAAVRASDETCACLHKQKLSVTSATAFMLSG